MATSREREPAKEVRGPMTEIFSTSAPAHIAVPRPRVSATAASAQGIGLSAWTFQTGSLIGYLNGQCMAPTNAAGDNTRKDAAGGEAFEDPV
jgi:hypothetical protein